MTETPAQPRARGTTLAEIIAEVAKAPWRAGFYSTLRRIEATDPSRLRFGRARRPEDEPLRLGQEPDLAFAPSTISGVQPAKGSRPPRLRQRFLGLFGPNGPLPLHLTEYSRQRVRNNGDPTFGAFADIFHHRILSLFYRVWAEARNAPSADRGLEHDRFAGYMAAVAGIGLSSLRGRDSVPDTVRAQFAARLACSARSPDAVEAVLADQFGLPVRITEFVGHWQPLDRSDQCRLGSLDPATSVLGRTSVLGGSLWMVEDRFRVTLGPMSLEQYHALRPDRPDGARLTDLVKSLAGRELDWDVEWIVHAEDIRPMRLDGSSGLGVDSWSVTRRHATDPVVRGVGSGDPALSRGFQ